MSVARHHNDWLRLVEVSGPFLSLPVLLRVFPDGLDRFEDEPARRARLRLAWKQWQESEGDRAIHREFVRFVLRELLELDEALLREGPSIPAGLEAALPEYGERLAPDLVLVNPPGRPEAGRPRLLINILAPSQELDRAVPGSRSVASPATRMMTLLHVTGCALGLLTNGARFLLVHAAPNTTPSYVSFDADLWHDEPVTLQAFHSLLGARRLFGVAEGEQLEALFRESEAHQHDVTDQLGLQVRRAVEVLIQRIDRINRAQGGALLSGITEPQLYEAAVTVMMRLVFLLAAEEQKMLPIELDLYQSHYAVSTLREQLQAAAGRDGEEVLERRYDAWSRLLAAFRAVHGGVRHDRLRLPAYGGSLFDPDRFPFLEGRAARTAWRTTPARPLPVDNLTVLDLLESIQELEVRLPGGGGTEKRRLSFRALDVEQIGHVYEGLLDHTARRAAAPVVGLKGSKAREPEIPLDELERRAAEGRESAVAWLCEQTGRSPSALNRAFEYKIDPNDARFIVRACDNDAALAARVERFAGLLRTDAHRHPVVYPPGAVYVTDGTARRATGTHYTPKSLTEPIVQYTLEPLCYEGPAEGRPRHEWRLKSPRELLALRVCDLAMGSGAFLVQACRYLSARLVEAWKAAEQAAGGRLVVTPEGDLSAGDPSERALPASDDERLAIARRYVADRCLYGVDINPMAVEMAKLSLWLVTLQKDRPFTFLDHALKGGDSLLGVTKIEQIEHFTLRDAAAQQLFASQGLREVVQKAAEKRRELESLPSDHYDQIERKQRLHAEAEAATEAVRAIGDLLIALELGAGTRDYEAQRAALAVRIRPLLDAGDAKSLASMARTELSGRRPFHWGIEFPEVMGRGGFDAFVGNPPFVGGQRISGTLGTDYRDFLVERIGNGQRGSSDLCAYLFLRAIGLLCNGGHAGFVATNTIAQGDTREVGLDQIVASGAEIIRATPSHPWPGVAALEVAHVWLRNGAWSGERILGEHPVRAISAQLVATGAVHGKPFRLAENEGKSFQGSIVLGMGFVLGPEEAQVLIGQDQRNQDVIFPYINGEDLTSRFDQSPSRWVINFRDWPLERAESYPAVPEGSPHYSI